MAGDGRGGGKSGGTRSHRHAEIVSESRLALLEARSRQFSRNLQLRSREIDENAGEVGDLGTRLLQLEKTVELCRGELEMLRLEVVEVKEHCQRGGWGSGNAEPQAERAEQKERLGVRFEQRKPGPAGVEAHQQGVAQTPPSPSLERSGSRGDAVDRECPVQFGSNGEMSFTVRDARRWLLLRDGVLWATTAATCKQGYALGVEFVSNGGYVRVYLYVGKGRRDNQLRWSRKSSNTDRRRCGASRR